MKAFVSFDFMKEYGLKTCAYSTRFGGVSKDEFASMNLGFNTNDKKENITSNFMIISEELDVEYEKLVNARQTHSTKVVSVNMNDAGKGIYKEAFEDEVDGLITNEKNLVLVGTFADCVPIYFYDKAKQVIALAHAGWRGTLGNIASQVIQKMKSDYGTNESDVVALIGPSISKCCFEVSKDVENEVKNILNQDEYNECVRPIATNTVKQEEKYFVDLKLINKLFLEKSGLLSENIKISDICTCCQSDKFHSHRKTKGKRGANAAFISL